MFGLKRANLTSPWPFGKHPLLNGGSISSKDRRTKLEILSVFAKKVFAQAVLLLTFSINTVQENTV